MKKLLFLLLAASIPVSLLQAGEKPFTLKGDLGKEVSGKLLLVRFTVSTGQRKDTLNVVNGKFSFKGKVDDERQKGQLIMLSQNPLFRSMLFYLEPGNITVRYSPEHRLVLPGGTPLNKQYANYLLMQSEALGAFNKDQPAGKKATQFDPSFQDRKLALIAAYISQYPSSPVGMDELNQYSISKKNPDQFEELYRKLSPGIQASPEGRQLASRISGMRSTEVGDVAPAFTLPDTEGRNVSLADFKGKYVLVDFWATWCLPCLAEMPHIVKAYESYKSKNFTVIGVSLDRPDSKEKWLMKIREQKMVWPQVSDLKWWNSEAALRYNINSVPANFLVDPAGKIIAKNLRGEALQEKLAEVLGK